MSGSTTPYPSCAGITGASPATATRDLNHLVDLRALTRTGERKHTRYTLAAPNLP